MVNNKKKQFFIVYAMLAFLAPKCTYQVDLKYQTTLDHKNNVRLEWSPPTEMNHLIHFKLIVMTPKLPITIGLGMSDHGEFTDADFSVFEVRSHHPKKLPIISFFDGHTDSGGYLLKDDKSDIRNVELKSEKVNSQNGNSYKIEIKFERELDTCDDYDYRIEAGTVHLLHFILNEKFWSIERILNRENSFSPKTDSDSAEMKQAQLVRSTYYDTVQDEFDKKNHKFFQVTNEKINLPAWDTTYWCKVYKLEEKFAVKHHIIAFESVISKASQGIVHHMELFHCVTDPSLNMRSFNGACNSEAKPVGLTQCRKVIAAWAMGASRFIYPEDVR